MIDNVIENMKTIGLAKLAQAVAEITLDKNASTTFIPIAFLDSINAAELLIRALILQFEVQQQDFELPESRINELVFGSSRLSFLVLPQELEKNSGYQLQFPQVYFEMNHLKKQVFKNWIEPEKLVKPTLKFAFKVIEPMLIEFWEEIILLHLPEFDFAIDEHINKCLTLYEINISYHDDVEY